MEYLTVTMAKERLGITKQRIHQLINKGLLDWRKLGKLYLIERGSVEKRFKKMSLHAKSKVV